MGTRNELHYELLSLVPNVYFQPPANVRMIYPCVVYNKILAHKNFANGSIYRRVPGYSLTVIETNPDSEIAEKIEEYFEYCSINNRYVSDKLLYHTTLNLYY